MTNRYSSRQADRADTDQRLQLVGFRNGQELFGVDILMVQEIIRGAPITPVPNAPPFVEGVTNLRGHIIPVIDLRKRLNLLADSTHSGKNWILILDLDDRVTGFIVDAVTEVLKIDRTAVEPPPDILVAGLDNQYLQGVCDLGDRLLILLDFSRLLRLDEIRRLKSVSAAGDHSYDSREAALPPPAQQC